MKQNTSAHLLSPNLTFYLIVLLAAFLILLGVSFDFTSLKNLLNSYAADGICTHGEILNSFWLILPTAGIILIIFALISVRKINAENVELLLPMQCFLLLIILTYLIIIHTRKLDNDEFEHMHNAWLMLEGSIPFFSINMYHTPLLEWVTALLIQLTGEKVIFIYVMRHVIFIISLTSLYLIYIITKEIFGRKSIAYIALILITTNLVWLEISYEIRPDNIMLLFALLSFLCLVKYLRKHKIHWLILFLLTALLSTFGKQNALVFYFALGLTFFYQLLFKKLNFRLIYILLFVAVLSFGCIFSPIRNFFIINVSRHVIPNEIKFWPTAHLLRVLYFNPFMYIMFIIHFFYYRKLQFVKSDYLDYIYGSIFILFTFLFLMNRPWLQEMLLMTVFICIVTAAFFHEIIKGFRIGVKSIGILAVIIMIPFYMYNKKILLKDRWRVISQIETTRSILRISGADDLVFDSYGKAIFRHHPLDPQYLIYRPEKFSRLSDVKKAIPRFLIKDEYYSRLPKETLLWFEDNYVSIAENSDIFVRKDSL